MNKKGQVIWYTLMISITMIVLSLALAPMLKQIIQDARSPDINDRLGLDCDNSSISIFDQSTCIVADVNLFYFVIGTIMIAGAIVGARLIIK